MKQMRLSKTIKKISATKKCCGCSACVQVCPAKSISMVDDAEGFQYPVIDEGKCLQCSKCLTVCPVVNSRAAQRPLAGYAFRVRDNELLRKTSSGGFFSWAATNVLVSGGVVFGAKFDEENEVVHAFIEKKSDLDLLRRSKYVQSRIGDVFIQVRTFLNMGRKVLFCGTPCQVKALTLFLGHKHDNLTTIDFICHGVPSPGVFRRYLKELAVRFHADGSLRDLNFRDKACNESDLPCAYSFSFSFHSGNNYYSVVEPNTRNIFLRGFIADIYLRPSCYDCPAKGFTSGADYTMCDFWNFEKFFPDFPMSEIPGVSQVLIVNDKLDLKYNREDLCLPFNPSTRRLISSVAFSSAARTHRRHHFMRGFIRGEMVYNLVTKYARVPWWEMAYRNPRAFIGRILRRLKLK